MKNLMLLALLGMSQAVRQRDEDNSPDDDTTVLWRVTPDAGDVPNHQKVQLNEKTVLRMRGRGVNRVLGDNTFLQYDESEGPTKEDNGDLDEVVVYREADVKNGEKFSGWTNPLSWTDEGADDDTVLVQGKSKIRYDESEGPTKEDNGDLDEVVVYREADVKNGEKFSGWTNPLSWTDDGDDDDTVLLQHKSKVRYDEAEGPTKEDNGELDEAVVYREADVKNGEKFSGWTNPLSWADDGNDDDTVLFMLKSKVPKNMI